MKKKALLLVSMGVLACTVGVTALAFGVGLKQNAFFDAKATGKSFVFAYTTGSQFENNPADAQVVDVETSSTDPIRTTFTPTNIGSLAFGQHERFVEAHPTASGDASYSLRIGINNLTHFEIDMGVANDGGSEDYWDIYKIKLLDKGGNTVRQWDSQFEPDGNGNGTEHIEWYKNDSATYTVVEVLVEFYFTYDSADTNLYIESLTLSWNC